MPGCGTPRWTRHPPVATAAACRRPSPLTPRRRFISGLPRDLIRERRCNAEWALVQQMEHLVEQFEEIEDSYLRERKHDVVQVVERVLKALMGRPRKLSKRGKDED